MQSHRLLKSEGKKCLLHSPACDWFLHSELFSEEIHFTIEIDPQPEIPFGDTFACPLPVNLILAICEAVLYFFTLIIHGQTCRWKEAPEALPYHSPSDAHHLRGLHSCDSREVLCCLAAN